MYSSIHVPLMWQFDKVSLKPGILGLVMLLHVALAAAVWLFDSGVDDGQLSEPATPMLVVGLITAAAMPDPVSAQQPVQHQAKPVQKVVPAKPAEASNAPSAVSETSSAVESASVTNDASGAVQALAESLWSSPSFDADYLHNPSPTYPAASRRMGEQGRVMLRVKVEVDGTASVVEVWQSSGFPRLDQAALNSVRHWRFVPARQGDALVSAWVEVPVLFNLRG